MAGKQAAPESDAKITVAYARVSSSDQKTDLERQKTIKNRKLVEGMQQAVTASEGNDD
jgi:predicted site-specific integrase-resolvase